MQSNAKTVKEYLAELPEDRRMAIATVRNLILENLPKGYEEMMLYGMICYVVPLKLYPAGYLGNKNMPITYIGLASQKNNMAIYLTNIYGNEATESWFVEAYKESGKKLNMGKSCIRFRKIEDLPLDLIGEAIALTSVKEMVKLYESSRKS